VAITNSSAASVVPDVMSPLLISEGTFASGTQDTLSDSKSSSGGPIRSATTVTRTVLVGGMPGWQIALIAVGAALIAAVVAVLADRAWSTRGKPARTAA
jgi:hypothetical protein